MESSIVSAFVCALLCLGSAWSDCVATVKDSRRVICDRPTSCSANWTTLTFSGPYFTNLPSRFFQPCTGLKELQMRSAPLGELNGERLRGLSSLSTLTLSEVAVHSLAAAVFSRVPKLQHFTVSMGQIRELRPESFKPCAELSDLSLLNNPLSHLRPFVFSECEITLKKIHLRSGKIRDFPASAFSRLTSLEKIDLTRNHLTALGPRLFSDLSDLRSLILRNNFIRSIHLDAFQGLTALRKLDLASNRITAFSPATLLHMPQLKRLVLSDNRILTLAPRWPQRALTVLLRSNRLRCRPDTKPQMVRFSGLTELPFCAEKTTPPPTYKPVMRKMPKSQRLAETRRREEDDSLPRKADNRQFILVTPSWLLVWAIIMTVAFAVVVCVLVFLILSKRRADRRRRDERAVQEVPLNEQPTL